MANHRTQHILGPKMDWTEDPDLLDTVLARIRNQEAKLNYVSLWAGKEARTYLNTIPEDSRDNL